eukprot:TRINITY_DN67059_c0_g1_i1.p1 TRINITY_DN67059_c0_g1~~TRINITY_DN67059_c0_g1_i1.p1  ORF type:complete len:300 (+),score=44.18 TRINITY_DN67059_c0_g1_i1:84-983(+)
MTSVAESQAIPSAILVQGSGKPKLDGVYERHEVDSSDRPCYIKRTEKVPMFLFWKKKWKLGIDLGSDKCFASVADEPGRLDPRAPYPHTWKVFDKSSNKYLKAKSMKVTCADAVQGQAAITRKRRPRSKVDATPRRSTKKTLDATPDKTTQKSSYRKRSISDATTTHRSGSDKGSNSDSDDSSVSEKTKATSAPLGAQKNQAPKDAVPNPSLEQTEQRTFDIFLHRARQRLNQNSDMEVQQQKLKAFVTRVQTVLDAKGSFFTLSREAAQKLVDILEQEFLQVPNPSQRPVAAGSVPSP